MNAQERALTKAKEKVEMLLWENATGVSIAEITGTLRISKPLAISALKAIGAVEQNGLWLIVDDEPAPVEVAPGAKADTAAVNENFTTELSGNSGELPASTENPVDPCPMPCIDQPEDVLPEGEPQGELAKELPEGEPEGKCPVCKVATDVAPLGLDGECQMCYEDATDKAWWDVVSDYSLIFENIMARVLSTIKAHGGATADRLRELTGMHPDDIEDAVQFMVDHGQLIGREVYFATVYEVAV